MATVGVYSFEAKIASCCYQVYKEIPWDKPWDRKKVKVELQNSKKVDPYACAIWAKEEYFKGRKTVGTFQDRYLGSYVTSSKQRVVFSMEQWYLQNFVYQQVQLVD